MADLLARRTASTTATSHEVLKILYGWLARKRKRRFRPTQSCPPTRHTQV
jgi:hypothetical protein